jgi:uncharacterized membrane protein (DUF485 family)
MADTVSVQGGEARKGAFRDAAHARVSWIATAATLAGYFVLMLIAPLAPQILALPLFDGGFGSLGIVVGIGVLVLQIAVSAWYTRWINDLDRRP